MDFVDIILKIIAFVKFLRFQTPEKKLSISEKNLTIVESASSALWNGIEDRVASVS